MKRLSCGSFRRFVLPSMLIGLVLSAGVARADYVYTFTSTLNPLLPNGSVQFFENSILTAVTTISTFSSDTLGLESLLLAPESGENCGNIDAPGPCIAPTFNSELGTITSFYYFSSNLTSTGTYSTAPVAGFNMGTLQISQVPEPCTFLLTGLLLLVGLWVARKQATGHRSGLRPEGFRSLGA
jgi:hypothetical protein